MDFIVVDLEATCWKQGSTPARMETIEIGALRLRERTFEIESEFQTFVRPVSEPVLSPFCLTLTGIRQDEVESAEAFPAAFARFSRWVESTESIWCSWGDYDRKQLLADAARHAIALPPWLERHVNLKRLYALFHGVPPSGMKPALRDAGQTLEGRHHRGLDDARNIVRLCLALFPHINPATRALRGGAKP